MGNVTRSRSVPVYKHTFDVPVQLLVRVQVVQPEQQLLQYDGDIVLADEARLHQVGAAAAGAELHDDPELGTLGVGAVVLGHKGRLQLGQDGDLLDDVLDLILGALDVDNLDGDGLAGALVDTGGRYQPLGLWCEGERE